MERVFFLNGWNGKVRLCLTAPVISFVRGNNGTELRERFETQAQVEARFAHSAVEHLLPLQKNAEKQKKSCVHGHTQQVKSCNKNTFPC